ncbi:hypothetical protein NC651_013785 [Populus alba x Populus x berolinensis]|nr:hypothetical protein NC651_013785 [Populus alba x Populus x berolinensis]
MCATSRRFSNCLEQYKKSHTKETPTEGWRFQNFYAHFVEGRLRVGQWWNQLVSFSTPRKEPACRISAHLLELISSSGSMLRQSTLWHDPGLWTLYSKKNGRSLNVKESDSTIMSSILAH